jgi:hypothetical protein
MVAEELLEMECEVLGKPLFEEIALLEVEEAEGVEEKVLGGEATKEEKIQLLKYKFLRKFTKTGREEVAPEVWNRMFVRCEGGKKTLEQQFWNIVHEKQRNLKEAWKAEASSRYAEQAKTSLMKQTCMAELCEVLGMTHSCEEKTWSHAEFTALAPEVLKLEEKLRKVLGLRAYQGKKKESVFLRASHLVGDVLEIWSGSVIEKKEIRKRDNGKIIRYYDIIISPFVKNMFILLKN